MPKTHGKILAILAASLVCLTLEAESNHGEVVGRWMDNLGTFWKQEITIAKKGTKYYRISRFQDGSSQRSELVEVKAASGERRRFKDTNNSCGEIYAIDNKGDLGLYDKHGFIRKAAKAKSLRTGFR